MNDERKPCPFCGDNPSHYIFGKYVSLSGVWCPTCKVVMPKVAWNRRPIEDDLLAALKAMRSAAHPWDDNGLQFVEAIRLADATIAKAEGGDR